MALDALIKKYFVFVLAALIALLAYFQASGTSKLLGAALLPQSLLKGGALAVPVQRVARDLLPTAQPLIDRNPFDSETGPLNKPMDIDLPAEREPEGPDLSNPLVAPRCDAVQLLIVTESDDPEWSIAALQGPGDPHPQLRRVGDTIGGGMSVEYIGFNPSEASPAVWLASPGKLCQALLFATQPPPAAPAAPAAQATPAPPPAAPSKGAAVPDDIKSKINRISETEFHVDRSVVDKILESQAELMRSARIVPEQKDGKVVGIRLFGIRPDSLLGTLGLQNGDRLETINGFDMASPEKALEAYARLRTAKNLNVKVNRRGKPLSIDFRIK